jgi:hypothetical protein
MRRILVENARRKKRGKHGGHLQRLSLEDRDVPVEPPADDILALDDALTRLAETDPEAARVVQLHFFAGLPLEQPAGRRSQRTLQHNSAARDHQVRTTASS